MRGARPAKGGARGGGGSGESGSAVARAFSILQCLTGIERPLALADLAQQSGLPKSSVHRMLLTLEREGLVQREPDGKRYIVGPRFASLAMEALRNTPQRAARHLILQALVDEVGETCNFTMLAGGEICYLDRVEAHWPLRMVLAPGSRVPLHCTASGKLFLALMASQQCRKLLTAAPLKRYTDNTITNPDRLMQALDVIRQERVGTDDEEFLVGLTAVSVPVVDRQGKMCAAVAVHAPTVRMNLEQARQHVPALRRAAAALAATCSIDST